MLLEEVILNANTGADAIKKAPIVEVDTGIKCLRIGDVSQKRDFIEWGFTSTTEAVYKQYKLDINDIIVARTGNTIGVNCLIEDDIESVYNNGLIRIKANKEMIIPRYLWYLISGKACQNYIQSIAFGTSTQPNMKIKDFLKFSFNYQDLETQEKIIKIINSIDEKIKINRKLNKNLAEQIHTLCNAWLNDYAPFGYVCPSDWKLTPLASFAHFISGYSYKGKELQESSVAMATIKNFDRNGGFKLDGYKEIVPSSKLKPEQHADLFDTLVAHTDLTQKAEVIGNAEPVLSFSGYEDIIFSMDVVKVVPDNPYVSKFLMAALLQTQQFKEHCLGYVNGTTVLHLSKKALPEYSLVVPKDFRVLKPLDKVVSSMYKQMALNIEECNSLTRTRDVLLPKLMSGELDISNIDI